MKPKKNLAINFVKKIKDELYKYNRNLLNSFSNNPKYNFSFKKIKKFRRFNTVVMIGMGGSILGSKAIYSFLKKKINKKFIFIDNLDQDFLEDIKKQNQLKKSLFLVVSKSGNTSETLVNLSFFKTYIKKSNIIIISENKKNVLANYARQKNYTFITHNHFIGGRYSIFSEVGMLSAYLMGLNPSKFKKNIIKILNNDKLLATSIQKLHKIKITKFKTIIFLNYLPELNDFLFWCQQLLAESLGKKGKGIIPIISGAPKDHHSLLQLYLDGPKDKTFYIFSCKNKKKLKIKFKSYGKEIIYLNNKNYEDVKKSQKNAFKKILKDKNIPHREILVNRFDENTIGKLFFLFIFETIAIAKMLKVNPYDQPAVEEVKILSKKFLLSKKFSKKNL